MQDIKHELEALEYLKNVVESYQEIASIRMRRVKKAVLMNREFLLGIKSIFAEVKHSYSNSIAKLKFKKMKFKGPSIRKTNGKECVVLLSANTGLYGDILKKTFDDFIQYVSQKNVDIIIVGKVGRRFYTESKMTKPIKYFDLSDTVVNYEELEQSPLVKILTYILDYEEITVFHGQFEDIIFQKPKIVKLAGNFLKDSAEDEAFNKSVDTQRRYLFEPSLYDVLSYFEESILGSMFEHTIHESNLSKFAARMISLDSSIEKINENITNTKFSATKLKHKKQNSKQLNTLASIYGRY